MRNDEAFLGAIDPEHYMSAEFRDLIVRMLAFDGGRRPTVHDIRNHAWMKLETSPQGVRQKL